MAPAPVPPEKEKEKQHQQEIYNTGHTSHASFAYLAIRALFLCVHLLSPPIRPASSSCLRSSLPSSLTFGEPRFVLKVFYSNIVVEGVEHIPKDGTPCILTANHSNSLTDALLLVTTVPRWVSFKFDLSAEMGAAAAAAPRL